MISNAPPPPPQKSRLSMSKHDKKNVFKISVEYHAHIFTNLQKTRGTFEGSNHFNYPTNKSVLE